MFLLDWLFPRQCYGCSDRGEYLCSVCQEKVKILSPERAIKWHKKGIIEKSVSLYPFHSPVDQILKDYKYQQVRVLKRILVNLLNKGLEEMKIVKYWQKEGFVFIPIPLHPFKELRRGFNQTEEILSNSCRQLDLAYRTDLVSRVKWTKSQTKLSFSKRQNNLKGAFRVNKTNFPSKLNLVIFDDVWTTGATIKACSQSFKNTPVNRIHSLTIFKRL